MIKTYFVSIVIFDEFLSLYLKEYSFNFNLKEKDLFTQSIINFIKTVDPFTDRLIFFETQNLAIMNG